VFTRAVAYLSSFVSVKHPVQGARCTPKELPWPCACAACYWLQVGQIAIDAEIQSEMNKIMHSYTFVLVMAGVLQKLLTTLSDRISSNCSGNAPSQPFSRRAIPMLQSLACLILLLSYCRECSGKCGHKHGEHDRQGVFFRPRLSALQVHHELGHWLLQEGR
jgi:hypothetical protein